MTVTVVTKAPTILLFGGYTEPWLESIDRIHEQAGSCAWLRLFLDEVASVVRAETRCMHPAIRNSLGPSGIFSSVQEVADLYRYRDDDVGFVQCIMSYIVRAVILLRWVHDSPDVLKVGPRPEGLGISGGLINAAPLAISNDFDSLYQASVVTAGFICRLCEVAGQVSRAVSEGGSDGSSWGCAIVGIAPEKLDGILHQIQESKNVPGLKRARVAIRGDHWGTVVGPPAVLDMCLENAAMKDLSTQRLPIYSMQHNYDLSQSHREYIAGQSPLHVRPVHTGFRLWGLGANGDDAPRYANWGALLLSVVDSAFSKPVDLIDMVKRLNTRLGSEAAVVELALMGDTWFSGSLTSKLRATGRRVAVIKHTELGTDRPRTTEAGAPSRPNYEGRIAVVGMAGRAPECDDLEQYWQVIESGRDLAKEIPKGRFDADELFPGPDADPKQQPRCTSKCKLGCFLDKPGHYDARFFRVSPREAQLMDPGSRLFQMVCHEALESAGYSCGTTQTTDPGRIAVLFGQSNVDGYETAHHEKGCDAYTLQALARPFAAGRVAFHYGWEGATYSVDQACSTSLSIIHLAAQGLLAGDHDMVVAGAANVMASPHGWCLLSKAGVLSNTGNCRTFRDDAQGYCRGEFVGVVVLKRLEDAVAHNDRILAVIPGSARYQAGNSTFLTASDAGAEERVLRQALRKARLGPSDIAYAEMHGTATPVGDPCEMTAVSNVLGRRPQAGKADDGAGPLTVGSVKANIGHSEASSGIASVIKSILMFQKGILPPQVGMPHALNKNFPPLEDKKIRILSKPTPFLPRKGKPRRVMVNNFDAAGGNTALIVEDFQLDGQGAKAKPAELDSRPAHVVVLSAHTAASHQANKSRLAKWLRANPSARLKDIAYTTTARRVHQSSFRFASAVLSTQELITALETESISKPIAKKLPVVFVFTGQGSHYSGMGAELYRTSPVFRDTVDLCQQIGNNFGFPPFLDIITAAGTGMIWTTAQTQLAVLALEVGLATFWKRLGVEPALVLGHSLGEYAALHVAGVLSLADALYLVGSRAALAMQKCNRAGACAMLAVAAPVDAVRDLLKTLSLKDASVACINSPTATVVSGSVTAVAQLQGALQKQKIRTKILPLPFGFHSFQVDAIVEDFVALASGSGVTFASPKIPVASTLLASIVDSEKPAGQGFTPEYLAKQARNAVDFVGAIQAVQAKFKVESPIWLEIGPSQVCGSFVQETLSPPAGHVVSTLSGAKSSPWASISECLASLYVHGSDPDWLLLHAPFENSLRLLTLPSYAWDAKDFWVAYTEKKTPELTAAAGDAGSSALVRQTISTCAQYIADQSEDKDGKARVTLGASLALPGFLGLIEGHRMQDVGLCPGAVFCESAFVAAKYALEHSGRNMSSFKMKNLSLQGAYLRRPLTASLAGPEGELHTTATAESDSLVLVTFKAVSRSPARSYDLGNCAVVLRNPAAPALQDSDAFYIQARMREVRRTCASRLPASIFYALFSRAVQYGSDYYRCVKEVFVSDDFSEAVAEVVPVSDPSDVRFVASSPYMGEALAHLAGFLVNCHPGRFSAQTSSFIMDSLERCEQTAMVEPGKKYFTYARVSERHADAAVCEVVVFDEKDKVVMRTWRMRFHEVPNAVLQGLVSGGKPAQAVVRSDPAPVQVAQQSSFQLPSPPDSGVLDVPSSTASVVTPATEKDNLEDDHQNSSSETPNAKANLLPVILESIAEETGADPEELTDDATLADVGVDSIMAVEICARVKEKSGFQLSPLFIIEHPTVGDLKRVFGAPQGEQQESRHEEVHEQVQIQEQHYRPESQKEDETAATGHKDDGNTGFTSSVVSGVSTPVEDTAVAEPKPEPAGIDETEPLPKARITLLQGRPQAGKPRLYLVCDGTGTITTYIHLLKHHFSLLVYGIDSPYLRCPSRLTTEIGIPGVAKLMIEALLKTQPNAGKSDADSILISGFSGGALFCYEMCRQLAEQGRRVDGLVILDMRSPLPPPAPTSTPSSDEAVWPILLTTSEDHVIGQNAGSKTMKHLRTMFACVVEYHPPRLAAAGSVLNIPAVVVWCTKGMVGRLERRRPELVAKLVELGYPVESYPGYMEEPKLGAMAWSLPHKRTEGDLGPGGWEKYVGAGKDGELGKNLLCLAVEGDHHDAIQPVLAPRFAELLDQGLKFCLERKS